jgi:tetratricopeptide (TPR) repeat protein
MLLAEASVAVVARAAQAAPQQGESARIRELCVQLRWVDVVTEAKAIPHRDPETNFCYGSALAQLNRWDEARAVFLEGRRDAPQDARFPIELAGVAYKQKNYPEAATWLRRGLHLSPNDTYANDFLATIYFLQGNLDAAVKIWNRIGKPRIADIRLQPGLRVDPELLDRAFTFAPADELQLPDLRTTETRLAGLGIFSSPTIRLEAKDNGTFDATFPTREIDGWGGGTWETLLSTFRGVGYETIYPQYSNISGDAINISTLVRWDSQKRRFLGSLSGPIKLNPKFHYDVSLDLGDENWVLRRTSQSTAPAEGGLRLGREALRANISSFESEGITWSVGVEVSHRDFGNVLLGSQLPAGVLLNGYQLKQTAKLTLGLWRSPERRFQSTAGVSSEAGAIWSAPSRTFEKLQASLVADWKPQSRGEDYAVRGQLRAGKTFGSVPFDELFMLGLERDNDLWMRGHIGTFDGQKGSAPLGRNYVLFNGEVDKNIYDSGLFVVKLSPFLDSGKITDPLAGLGSREWLWDTGMQLKVRVLGVGFTFSYGKDLRTGNNAFYLMATPRVFFAFLNPVGRIIRHDNSF